jgi:TetR/AcrR family transcriptional regulator, transcriptional repressor for nem operon
LQILSAAWLPTSKVHFVDTMSYQPRQFLTPCQKHLFDASSNTICRPGASAAATEERKLRPREFDNDHVLRIAFDQFWRKGARGTSFSDIAREAGVQRGSLYNAFESKEALFLIAYERYASEYLASIQETLSSGSLRECLTAFFDVTIRGMRSGSPPRGCPTTRGLMELGSAQNRRMDEKARQKFASLLTHITGLLQKALSEGVKRGEFDGSPETAALHILTVTRGLAVLERAFGDEGKLRKIAAHTVDLVLGE